MEDDYSRNAPPDVLEGLEPTRNQPTGCSVPEPMIFRKARVNAAAIRAMGREEIAKGYAVAVPAHYVAPELGEGVVREDPDGRRHLERQIKGAWAGR